MRTSTGTTGFDDLPTNYDDLVRLHMPRPIHDDVELENATELIDLMAGHDLSADQDDYLDLLSDLVAKYEEETSPVGKGASPKEVLAWLIEEHDMSVTELGEPLGDRSLGSRILSGERSPSKSHIKILADHFKVSPAAFISHNHLLLPCREGAGGRVGRWAARHRSVTRIGARFAESRQAGLNRAQIPPDEPSRLECPVRRRHAALSS